jgi:N-acetylglucosaminyldiphosphoundecaprenol N-acetyl-beta-D-mannosaminyltransferase
MIKILGVKIDNLSKEEILKKVEFFLSDSQFHQIATVNPEFIIRAGEDPEFKNILNNCDLNIADGSGIKLAFWRYGKKLKCRMAGIDLMLEILKLASQRNLKVFLAASSRGLSSWELTRDSINKMYPSLEISGANTDIKKPYSEPVTMNQELVFCNFGTSYQEKFLNSLKSAKNGLPPHLCQNKNYVTGNFKEENNFTENIGLQEQRCRGKIRLAMGVGGSFDYLTGKVPRAPEFMRQIGLEWLFRLIIEPRYRFKRIWNAVVIFPIKVIFNQENGS